MTYFRPIILLGILSTAIACVTLPPQYENSPAGYNLNPEAAKVHVVEFIPSADREKWDEVRMLNCTLGFNAESAQTNINSCIHKFKNEAYELGSELVLVKPENKRVGVDTAIDQWSGRDMNCTNCVDIKGIVLKSKAKNKTVSSSKD